MISHVKRHTLMWLNPKPNVELKCVSTNNQIAKSNVGPPYIFFIIIGYIFLRLKFLGWILLSNDSKETYTSTRGRKRK